MKSLRQQNAQLRRRLAEAQDALRAIREGQAAAIVVDRGRGPQVFSLTGAETVYRLAVETMAEGVVNVVGDGRILFCNARLGQLLAVPMEQLLGRNLREFVFPEERPLLDALLEESAREPSRRRLVFRTRDEAARPMEVAGCPLVQADGLSLCLVVRDLSQVEGSARQIDVLHEHQRQMEQIQGEVRQSRRAALNLMEDAVAARERADQAFAALRQSEERYRLLFDGMTEGFALHEIIQDESGRPCDYRFLDVNPAFERLTGLSRADLLGKRVTEVLPGNEPHWIEDYGRVALTGEPLQFTDYSEVLGRWYQVLAYRPAPGQFAVVFSDVTERRRVQRERDLAVEFLEIINRSVGLRVTIDAAIDFFRRESGCEAVGVRLKESDDYPYYETRGLGPEFVQAENSLCLTDAAGNLRRDAAGHPLYVCLCGAVLASRGDTSKPYFTAAGSFWTNSITELSAAQASCPESERNRCVAAGYESIALIGLRAGSERLGLLRLHDRRPGRFKPEQIAFWEWLGEHLAVAIAKGRAEDSLRESKERFAGIVESAMDAIISVDEDQRVVLFNAAAQKMFGCTAQEAMGQPLGKFIPQRHRAAHERHVRRFGEAGVTARQMGALGEISGLRASGEEFPIEASISQVMAGGHKLYTVILRDITVRKQTEESLRQSRADLDRAEAVGQIGWWRLDVRQNVLTWSDENHRIFGIPKGTPLTYETFLGTIHPDDRQYVDTQWNAGLRGQPYDIEHRILVDGQCRWVREKAYLEFDHEGGLLGGFGITQDITARKQAEDSLRQARAQAEAASRAKDHFLAVLSHELRNPLNPVLAAAAALADNPRFDAETREQLEIIRRNAEMEARLIDDLLDVTRIERGKVELDRRAVDLGTILHRAVEVCMPDIRARRLEFGVDAPDGPYWVHADAARLQQVFWNLLKNSIKFTPAGGCVGVRCRREGEGQVRIEVNDSGEGIEAEALSRIFNAFEQAERSITRQFGGLGLGLTISKAMVEMHGGRIEAQSHGRGKGATFIVRLPLLAAHALDAAARASPPAPSPTTRARPLRILLVEDHGDTARIMRMLLTADGHQVEVAADVATALALAESQEFELLLSDLGLPDGSGLDLMQALRDRGIELPAIAMSGFGQEQDIQESRRAGFSTHLVKPITLRKLQEAVAACLGLHRRAQSPQPA
jgi:PAS domain S-box-containing protein